MLSLASLRCLRTLAACDTHAAFACQSQLRHFAGDDSRQSSESDAPSEAAQSFHLILNPDLEGGALPGRADAPAGPSSSYAAVEELQQHTYVQPSRLLAIPEATRPRFRMPTKRRPDPLSIDDIWTAVRGASKLRSDESIDVSISLAIDARKSDQLIRGATALPHGTGRDKRVAVFARGDDADAAREAGATLVGDDDLIAIVAAAKGIDADVVIATPDMMPLLGKVARILGPKGLMPNPKMGTITTHVKDAVTQQRMGQVQFRNDKGGVVSASIGRASFGDAQLSENFYKLFNTIMDMRPKSVKGTDLQGFVKRVSVSCTQGKGFPVQIDDLQPLRRSAFAEAS